VLPAAGEAGVAVRGTLASHPEMRVLRAPDMCGVEALVQVRSVSWGRIRHRVRGGMRLRVTASCEEAARAAASWRRADRLRAHVRLVRPRSFRNPGAFDAVRYHRARGVEALGSAKSLRLVRVSPRNDLPALHELLRIADRAREKLLGTIDAGFAPTRGGRRAAAVSAALLLGERSGLSADSSRRLQEAGLSHLLAVSGFNVAVLAGLVMGILAAVRVRGRLAAALCLPVLWAYLLLNRDESSVTRAVLMATMLLGGRVLWRRSDARNVLGVAALAQLAVSPEQIRDAAFQLTFLATWALIELAVPAWMGEAEERTPRIRRRPRAWRWAQALLLATVAATAATLPLTVSHFNRVSPGTLPANLVAGPLMSGAFLGVIAMEGLAPVWPAGARATAGAIDRGVDLVFATSSAVTSWRPMSYRRPTPHPVLAAGALLTLAAAVGLSRRAVARRSGSFAAAGLAWMAWGACTLLLCLPLDTRRPPDGLRITAFDVGQGDALLLETPGGDRILVDAGGVAGRDFDMGERVVSRALWSLGIARLDRVVITHADLDHAGGAASVIRNFSPAQVWIPAGWHGVRSRVARGIAEASPPWTWLREVRSGDAACLAGARLAVLHPRGARGDPGDNERSIVLSFSSRTGAALLMGDAGDPTESLLLSSLPQARLLKVGHHGSRTATGEALLARVRPALALIPCGEGNRFGHPHAATLRRLESCGARVLRTDRSGSIEVELLPRATRLATGLRATRSRRAGG
jgi:competence protein ComEC